MPGCIFKASGRDFDVDAFVAQTSLHLFQIFHRGDAPSARRGPYESSGFKVDVSQADGCLRTECEDAEIWLSTNLTELLRLAAYTGVEDLRLDFGYNRRANALVQSDYLPPSLLALAGKARIGIELSLYAFGEEFPEGPPTS
jgi:hypothetical protein